MSMMGDGSMPPKDPSKPPKKAQTAYFVFLNGHRQKMLQEKPEMTVREVVSQLGAQWRSMSAEAKKPYEEVARQDKIRADQEKSAWLAAGNEMPPRRKKKKHKKKKKREGIHVKRASSAYIFFLVSKQPAVKAANPTFRVGDVAKEIGRMWREMSEEQKAPYQQMQAEDQERHRNEMEAKLAAENAEKAAAEEEQQY